MNSPYVFVNVLANTYEAGYTSAPGPDLGVFRIRGANPLSAIENHQFILADIQDTGHRLLVHVFYGGRERFVVENVSDPTADKIFSYKHASASKKNFKPGDILSSPEHHILSWFAPDLSGQKNQVVLILTPRYSVHGIRLFYTLEPK